MPTSPDPNVELARGHVVQVLNGSLAPFSLDYLNPHAEPVVQILNDLCTTQDAFERKAKDAIESLERALPFVRGADVSFNGVGILQLTGIAIDQLACLFVKQREYSLKALTRYYQHEAASAATAAAAAQAQRARDDLIISLLNHVDPERAGELDWTVSAELEDGLEVRVTFPDETVRTFKTSFDGEIVELNQEGVS